MLNRSDIDRLSPLARGLVCYYPLNEPNGGAAQCVLSRVFTAPSGTSGANSVIGRVRSFNGSADHIATPTAGPSGGAPFSVSFWCRPGALVQFQRLVSCLSASPFNGWEVYAGYTVGGGELVFQLGNGGSLVNTRTASVLAVGRVAHVVATFTGTWSGSAVGLYVNGSPQALTYSSSLGITAGSSAQTVNLARWPGGTGYNFNGALGGFGLWNRVLTPDEVATLYADPEALFVPAPSASRLYVPPSAVTGSGAITEARDVASGTGGIVITGAGSVTEARDTATGAGGIIVTGAGNITEARDVAAGSGGIIVTGSGSITESRDIATGTGPGVVTGSGAIIEARDIATGTGGIIVRGSGAITERRDTVVGFGTAGDTPSHIHLALRSGVRRPARFTSGVRRPALLTAGVRHG